MSQFIYGFLAAIVIPIVVLFSAGYFGLIPQIKPLVVQSGSMEPSIKTGSVVFTQKSPDYKKDDVISFSPNNDKNLVTHRIFSFDGTYFQTKGDANEEEDFWKIKPDQIKGKVVLYIPYLGYGVDFAKQPKGFIFLVIIPATIIIYEELKTIRAEIAKLFIRLRPVISAGGAPKLMVIFPLFGLGLLWVTFTGSFFLDNEETSNNVFTVAASFSSPTPTPSPISSPSPSPSPGVSAGDVVINEIMWMGTQGDAADEFIELRNMTSNTIDLSNWVVDNLGSGVTDDIVIPAGKSIGPNGFFLITNDTQANSNVNVAPDHTTNINLINPGEQLRLRTSAGGTIIDTADNDGGGWFAGVDPGGQNPEKSMERNDVPGDGTVASNWHTATSAVNMDPGEREIATPRATNSSP